MSRNEENKQDDWLNVVETAGIFEVSDRTIRRWINRGLLKTRKGGPFSNSPQLVSRQSIDELKKQLDQSE